MAELRYEKPQITDEQDIRAMAGAWACAFNPPNSSCWGGNLPNLPSGIFNQGANDRDCYPVHSSP